MSIFDTTESRQATLRQEGRPIGKDPHSNALNFCLAIKSEVENGLSGGGDFLCPRFRR